MRMRQDPVFNLERPVMDCAKARDCLARLADEMGWGDDA